MALGGSQTLAPKARILPHTSAEASDAEEAAADKGHEQGGGRAPCDEADAAGVAAAQGPRHVAADSSCSFKVRVPTVTEAVHLVCVCATTVL